MLLQLPPETDGVIAAVAPVHNVEGPLNVPPVVPDVTVTNAVATDVPHAFAML